jgi:hypothetical protein
MGTLQKLTGAFTAGIMAVVMVPALASAASNTVTVTQDDVTRQAENTPPTNNWVEYYRTPVSEATFRTGPGTPPLGKGSVELVTPTGSDKVWLFNYDHIDTSLSNIDEMRYSTYRSAGTAQQVTALNIQVDVNGDAAGGFTTLVFEPVYNTDQGVVVNDAWQDWDAYKGGDATWWSSNNIPSAPNRDTFVSWDTIVAANPDAVIIGGFGINQGSGNPGLTTAVDALAIGASGDTTVYNFEQTRVSATNKDQCKNGGFRNFQTEYKNQGDCVSAVASEGKAKGNPEKQANPVQAFFRSLGF